MKGYLTVQVRKYAAAIDAYLPDWETVSQFMPNLLTNNGRDEFHKLCYTNTAGGTRGYGFIALSANSGAPAAADTLLTTELSVNGLARVDAGTKTHTGGTNQTTIEHTFTANANFTDVRLSGLFNSATTDTTTLSHEASFTSTSLSTSDLLKITWTLNLG